MEYLKKLLSIILVQEGHEDIMDEDRRTSNEYKQTGVRGREMRDEKLILRLIQILDFLIREDKKHKTDMKTDISSSSY
jgi:hypothetical protein